MASKRMTVLMGVLLVLVLGYVSRPLWEPQAFGPRFPVAEPPLPGSNSVTGLDVRQDAKGRWIANFDYFYTGAPQPAWVTLNLASGNDTGAGSGGSLPTQGFAANAMVQRGSHHLALEVQRPATISQNVTTTRVVVQMHGSTFEPGKPLPTPSSSANSYEKIVASQQVDQVIDWPDMQTWFYERQFAEKTTDQIYQEAVSFIDVGDSNSLAEGKRLVEHLIRSDPQFDAGYIELARIAMKSNWGPEGLHQAETLIQSALQIRPESVRAREMLGYIYTHQKRYKQAEKIFVEVSKSDQRTAWLWADWGEALVMQGDISAGIAKYRQALIGPRKDAYNDRARLDAYWHLIALLDKRHDLDGLEATYKQRADEFGSGNCYNADYGRFVLQHRGDPARAIALARKAVDGHCTNPGARETLGLAHYAAWASAPANLGAEMLNQARAFLPVGAKPLYLLASSDKTVAAARRLIETGEAIDQCDNNGWDALAYALQDKDYATATRLIRMGARTDAPVGPGQMPVALLPIVDGDFDGIRFMRKSGVDYSKLTYQGVSVLDQVKRGGNRQLLDAVDPKASRL